MTEKAHTMPRKHTKKASRKNKYEKKETVHIERPTLLRANKNRTPLLSLYRRTLTGVVLGHQVSTSIREVALYLPHLQKLEYIHTSRTYIGFVETLRQLWPLSVPQDKRIQEHLKRYAHPVPPIFLDFNTCDARALEALDERYYKCLLVGTLLCNPTLLLNYRGTAKHARRLARAASRDMLFNISPAEIPSLVKMLVLTTVSTPITRFIEYVPDDDDSDDASPAPKQSRYTPLEINEVDPTTVNTIETALALLNDATIFSRQYVSSSDKTENTICINKKRLYRFVCETVSGFSTRCRNRDDPEFYAFKHFIITHRRTPFHYYFTRIPLPPPEQH